MRIIITENKNSMEIHGPKIMKNYIDKTTQHIVDTIF